MSASVVISLDRSLLLAGPITVRIQTPDFAVVAEGPPGLPLDIPTEGSFFATAIDSSGNQVSDALRIDMAHKPPVLDVTLSVKVTGESKLKLQPEGILDAGFEAADDDVADSPPFQFVHVLRKHAAEVFSEPDRLDSQLSIRVLDANEAASAPAPSGVSAFGVLFSGPRGKRLSVSPVDLSKNSLVVPPFHWSPTSTPGYSFPSYVFDDPAVNELVNSLGRPTSRLRTFSSLFEPSLASVLWALIAIRDPRQWQRLDEETRGWNDGLRWIPDACIVRTEILARLGKHAEARSTLGFLPRYSVPWTRLALISVTERLDFYDQRANNPKRLLYGSRWYRNLLGKCHPTSTFCVFELSPQSALLKAF